MNWTGLRTAFQHVVRRLCEFAVVLALGMAPMYGTTLERLSLDDLVAKSTAIVRGQVTGSYAAFRGPVIYTHYAVRVSEQFKGSSGSTVDVVVPGGTANNLRQMFSGTPKFQTGDEFVFFLWTGPSGLTQIMGLTQGLFQLSISASTVMATRAASAELMLDPGNGRPVKDQTLMLSLSDLKARIANRLGRAEAR